MSKSGAQIGAENLETLRQYLAALEAEGGKVPMRGGKPNASAIALACGFDRQVLYKNPACRDLLEETVRKIGGASVTSVGKSKSHDPKDKRIRDLEKRLADLQEQLGAAQQELEEIRPYRKLYELALETGRDL